MVKHRALALGVSLVLVAGVLVAPPAAMAGRGHGGGARGGHAGGRPSGVHHGGGVHHVGPRGHPFIHRGRSFGFVAAPAVYATSPFWYDPAPSYDQPAAYDYAPPIGYGAPMGGTISMAPSPPPPPTPSVVEFPNGRYELRGDGVSMPYTWVWVPNPPTVPPPGPPPPGNAPPSRRSQLYRWTDDDGVVHLSDQPRPMSTAISTGQ